MLDAAATYAAASAILIMLLPPPPRYATPCCDILLRYALRHAITPPLLRLARSAVMRAALMLTHALMLLICCRHFRAAKRRDTRDAAMRRFHTPFRSMPRLRHCRRFRQRV